MDVKIDELLAAAMRGESLGVPDPILGGDDHQAMIDRIHYHGVAGLLAGRLDPPPGWPTTIAVAIRDAAIARAMWELRHRQLLNELLAALAREQIIAILLKGTALAYDLYLSPATRTRGDSDILIKADDLAAARRVLRGVGFDLHGGNDAVAGDYALQEVWTRSSDGGTAHHIDLHWQLLNAPALGTLLSFDECSADLLPLPRLGPHAFGMDRVRTLIHTCIHRALHVTSPYFVNGETYYGGDRLIWLHDIHLLANVLTHPEWTTFCDIADAKGISATCLDGLHSAKHFLATMIPARVTDRIAAAPNLAPTSLYLRSRQFGRAWRDLRAIPGLRRKLGYVGARVLPDSTFVRAKYPQLAKFPTALLYARRMIDLIRARPQRSPDR